MRRVIIREYGCFARDSVEPRLLRRLKRFDHACASTSGQTVFDWADVNVIRAQNYVGVIQLRGLIVEILPKITEIVDPVAPFDVGLKERELAQKNLLYMLSVAGEIPFEERQLADQRSHRMPLIEALIDVFARALVRELRRGIPQAYVDRRENLVFVRGKVLHAINARMNAAHRERLFSEYQEFLADTPLNRILLATCCQLQQLYLRPRTLMALGEAELDLADVSHVQVTQEMFNSINLNRSTERFSAILGFCRMVLLGQTFVPGLGRARTFSLLFPMEKVFEGFVGGFIRRYPLEMGLTSAQVRLQSVGAAKWLVRTADGTGRFRLRPDILIEDSNGKTRSILDTKWKRPRTDVEDAKNGIAPSDMYQLYAYANRFNSPDNVLLYPAVAGVTPKVYYLEEAGVARRIRIEFLDITRDLYARRSELAGDLRRLLGADEHITSSPNERTL